MLTRVLSLPRLLVFFAVLVVLLIVAACDNNRDQPASSDSEAANSAAAQPTPTILSGAFVAVGEQSVFSTTVTLTETTQTTTTTAGAVTVDLSLGERAYTKNKCADCHGGKGEGVADKGKAVAGTPLSFEDFDVILRTGGGLGNSHIFGRSAVSPTGMEALYQYVQSLQ